MPEKNVDLADFLENAPISILCLGPNGLIRWANAAELCMLGYTREEYIGRHIKYFHADQHIVEDILHRVAQGETLHDYEARLLCKDGSVKQVLISSNGLWEDGSFVYTRCFTRDITDRKRTEELLHQIEARYRALLSSAEEGMYGIDCSGNCTFANNAAAHMLGYRVEEMLGRPMHGLIHHSRADRSPYPHEACRIHRAFPNSTGCRLEGEVFWRADGTSFAIKCSSYPVFEHGILTGAVIAFTDINEHQRVVQELRSSEERFRQLTEHIRESFWITDPERNQVFYISPGYETIWGRSCVSLYISPQSWFESVHPEDRETIEAQTLRSFRREAYDVEYRIVRPDGTVRWVHDRGFPIRDESGTLYRFAGIAEDITEYKRANEELQVSLTQLRTLSSHMEAAREEERSRIGREIHDDLGSVLTYLKLDLSRLNKSIANVTIGDASRELQDRITGMIDAIDGAIKTVQQISSEMRPVLLEHAGLTAAIIWQARQFEGRTGIRCVFTSSPNVCGINKDQSTLVFRIFQEALTNVARHTTADLVKIDLYENCDQLVLIIEDNGNGIPKKEVSDPLSFGLLGMQERARLAGGELSVTGMETKGTTVAVRIPINRS